MRHGKKVNHLSRTDSHRRAMLANMASSLILHKRITTTLAKAKADILLGGAGKNYTSYMVMTYGKAIIFANGTTQIRG